MSSIFAQRGIGDRRGPDIIEILLATLDTQRARGTQELDENSGLDEVQLLIKYRTGIVKGQLVEVHDILQGKQWVGKITGIRHIAAGGVIQTEIILVRESNFVV